MLGGSLKRGLDDDSPSVVDNVAKMRKEDEQSLRETEPFVSIDDIISELRFIDEFETQVKSDRLRRVIETLVQWKQDVARLLDQRFIYSEDIPKLHRLVDEHVGKSVRGEFDELMEKMGSNDRLNIDRENVDIPQRDEPFQQEIHYSQSNEESMDAIEQEGQMIGSNPDVQNHVKPVAMATTVRRRRSHSDVGNYTDESDDEQSIISVEGSSCESDTDSISTLRDTAEDILALETLQQEQHSPQAIEQSAATVKEDEQAVDLMTDTHNTCNSGGGFVSPSGATRKPLEFSNNLKTVAEINFNAEVLKTLRQFCYPEGGSIIAIDEVCDMVKQRTTLIKNQQYEYSLAGQQLFYIELVTKLRVFEQQLIDMPELTFDFQKVFDMIQLDAVNPALFVCPCVRYLTDFNLLEYIMNNSDRAAAHSVLRARKLQLKHLSIDSKYGCKLTLNESILGDNAAGISDLKYRAFQYGTELNKVNTARLLNIITQYYDVSQSSISLRSFGSNTAGLQYHSLRPEFGEPPKNQYDKIRIEELTVESPGMAVLLRWFCPRRIVLYCDSKVLIVEPSLLSGVDLIVCRNMKADQLVESSKAKVIQLEGKSEWSKESICRVLTAHRLSTDNGSVRYITYHCHKAGIRFIYDWIKIFSGWLLAFEAEYGQIGRKVTWRDYSSGKIMLTLH